MNTIRKTKYNFILTTAIIFLMFASGCNPADDKTMEIPQNAQAGEVINLDVCTYEARDVEYAAECGTLVVPENRSVPDSRLIAIPVIRVNALGNNPAEPIFWLAGGPGSSNMSFSNLEGLIDGHDIVMVGYRGIDGSVTLECPEMANAIKGDGDDLLSESSMAGFGEAMTECAGRLDSEGVDLDGYSIPEVIEDMEDARNQLGYVRLNLLSGSYGTRVAIIYAWMYPESIHRSIMVAVNPPGHFVWEPEVVDAQITYDAGLCAADPLCSARTNDLAKTIQNVADNMPPRWLFIKIDPGKVKFISHFMMFHRGSAATIFDAYLSAEEGDPSGLALMSIAFDFMIPGALTWGDWAAKGSIDYDTPRDWIGEMDPPDSIIGAPTTMVTGGAIQLSGGGWPVAPMPDEYREMQPSDVETLLVSGNIDYSTPPQFATDELLPALSTGHQIILSEFGHTSDVWGLQPEAMIHMVTTFYDTGEVDDSQFTYESMDFDVGLLSFPFIAKALMVMLILILLLLAVLVRRIVRRVKWRKAKLKSFN